jgi:hypothetical protein
MPTVIAAPAVSASELEGVLDQAEALIDEERFTQASDLLSEVLPGAVSAYGRDSGAVVDLRIRRAAALFLGGDYRKAAPEFDALAATVAKLDGPDSEEALDYRRQAVVCRVALGESARALTELEAIVGAYERVDPHGREYLELRLSLVRLRLGVGQDEQARQELGELARAAGARLGENDDLTVEIAALLSRLHNESGQ